MGQCFGQRKDDQEASNMEKRQDDKQSNSPNPRKLPNGTNVGPVTSEILKEKPVYSPKLTEEQKEKKEKIRTRVELFEKQLPMRKLTIEEWSQILENTAVGSESLKIDEIIGSLIILKDKDFFKDGSILSKEGVFYHILKECKLLRYGEDQHLSKRYLLIWGLLYCKNDPVSKAKFFYDVLQDSGLNSIAILDKDFPAIFSLMIDLSTKVVNSYEILVSKSQIPEYNEKYIETLDSIKEEILEMFLDQVFDNESTLTREQYEKSVSQKSNQWIFNAAEVRQIVQPRVEQQLK